MASQALQRPQDLNTRDPSTIIPVPTPSYYSFHNFQFTDDGIKALAWLVNIGPSNVSSLRQISIRIHSEYIPPELSEYIGKPVTGVPWCKFLNRLSTHARNLREIKIFWNARVGEDPILGLQGGGADYEVLDCLTKIRGLEKLTIGGYFKRDWPDYLVLRMDMDNVWVVEGENATASDRESLESWRQSIGDYMPGDGPYR